MSEIIPVLVLGGARNGTTWLCNDLCLNEHVAGVQHKSHWGIHESNIYNHLTYWGDLSDDDRFIRFLELYSSADYFRLTGEDKEYFYTHRPADFVSFFFTLMDRFARREGKAYWTTKLDPLYLYRPRALQGFLSALKARYSRYHFVGIQRALPDVLRSYVYMEGRAHQHRDAPGVRQLAMLLNTARYVTHYEAIHRLIQAEQGHMIEYEAFQADRAGELGRTADALGMPPFPEVIQTKFVPNSSFAVKKEIRISKGDLFLATRIWYPLFSAVRPLARFILLARDRQRGLRIPLSWRLLKMKYMPDSLGASLERAGDVALRNMLFGQDSAGGSRACSGSDWEG